MKLKLPNMLLTTLLAMAAITIIGLLGGKRGGITLELGAPLQHPIAARNGIIQLPIILRLENHSNERAELSAPDPCRPLRFVVTTAASGFVQASPRGDCARPAPKLVLEGGAHHEEITTLSLDAARYRAGDYMLQVQFWGEQASDNFTLTR